MSFAYQVRRRDAAHPAAIAKVSAPEAICSAVAVRRHEDVGRGEQVGQLVDGEEAIVELDVVLEAEVDAAPLQHQPVLLALAARHLRVGAPGDQVEHLRMPLDDRRQRVDHRLEPLARARSARRSRAGNAHRRAGRGPGAASTEPLPLRATEHGRRAVRHDADLLRGQAPHAQEQRRAVSVITITRSASSHSAVSTSR